VLSDGVSFLIDRPSNYALNLTSRLAAARRGSVRSTCSCGRHGQDAGSQVNAPALASDASPRYASTSHLFRLPPRACPCYNNARWLEGDGNGRIAARLSSYSRAGQLWYADLSPRSSGAARERKGSHSASHRLSRGNHSRFDSGRERRSSLCACCRCFGSELPLSAGSEEWGACTLAPGPTNQFPS
jgi:hypothetical protein